MDFELMANTFPKLLNASVITLKLLSVSLIIGLFIGLLFAILRLNKNVFINNNFFELLSVDSWSKVALTFLWLFVILFLGYLFAQTVGLKRSLFFLSVASLIFFTCSVLVTFLKDTEVK